MLEEMAVKEMEEERRRRRRRGRVDGGGAHRHGAHLRGGAHRELVVERGHVDLAREGEHDDRRRRDGGEAGVEEMLAWRTQFGVPCRVSSEGAGTRFGWVA